MREEVTTICYGQRREWTSRQEAIDFFEEGVRICDGAERERYTTILLQLIAGVKECSDK